MKRTVKIFNLILLTVFFIPYFVNAQSGHFVLLSQGQVSTLINYPTSGGTIANYQLGTGLIGTTTSVFLYPIVSGDSNVGFVLQPYTDPNYTIPVNTNNYCNGAINGTGNIIDGTPTQIPISCGTMGNVAFNPLYYYLLNIAYVHISGTTQMRGGASTTQFFVSNNRTTDSVNAGYPNFAPYFVIITDNFQISPTSTDSGILLSGAQSFCNNAFASSTGIGSTIGNGFCIALGFLFIPNQDSITQYKNLPTLLQNKLPFSYINDTKNIIDNLQSSSTQNMKSFELDYSNTHLATSSVIANNILSHKFDLLSTTTISTYVNTDLYNLLYGLEVSAIWVGWLFVAYRRIIPHKAQI